MQSFSVHCFSACANIAFIDNNNVQMVVIPLFLIITLSNCVIQKYAEKQT